MPVQSLSDNLIHLSQIFFIRESTHYEECLALTPSSSPEEKRRLRVNSSRLISLHHIKYHASSIGKQTPSQMTMVFTGQRAFKH